MRYYSKSKSYTPARFIFAVFMVVVTLIFLLYRSRDTIEVHDRWWRRYLDVRYDVESTSTSYECEGTGDNRECEWETDTDVTTHIRCTSSTGGTELPTIRPEQRCSMLAGDYLLDHEYYRATYTLLDKDKAVTTEIVLSMWDVVEPGSRRYVVRNIYGTVLAIAEE